MTRSIRQLLSICRDLDIEVPDAPANGFKVERLYSIQMGYPEGWSWLVRDGDGFEWLASQWGIADLVEFHRDGRLFTDLDERATVLCVKPASTRTTPLTHYGQSRPFAGCKKGLVDGDKLTMDHDKVDCRDCLKAVRKSKKAAKREEERRQRRAEWEDSLSPEQRKVMRRAWGFPDE